MYSYTPSVSPSLSSMACPASASAAAAHSSDDTLRRSKYTPQDKESHAMPSAGTAAQRLKTPSDVLLRHTVPN